MTAMGYKKYNVMQFREAKKPTCVCVFHDGTYEHYAGFGR